jgi:hypothetical protein
MQDGVVSTQKQRRRTSPQLSSDVPPEENDAPTTQITTLSLMRDVMKDLGYDDFTGDRGNAVQLSKYYFPNSASTQPPLSSSAQSDHVGGDGSTIRQDVASPTQDKHNGMCASSKRNESGIASPTLEHMTSALSGIVLTPQWTVEASLRLAQPSWKTYLSMVASQLSLRPVFTDNKRSARPKEAHLFRGQVEADASTVARRAEVIDVIRAARWMLRQLLRRWCAMFHIITALSDPHHRDHQIARHVLSSAPAPHHFAGKRLILALTAKNGGGAGTGPSPPSSLSTDEPPFVPIESGVLADARRRVLARVDEEFQAMRCASRMFPIHGGQVSGKRSRRRSMLLNQHKTRPAAVRRAYTLWSLYAVTASSVMKRLLPPGVTAPPSRRQLRRWCIGGRRGVTTTPAASPVAPPSVGGPSLETFVASLIPTPLSRADLRGQRSHNKLEEAPLIRSLSTIDQFPNGGDVQDAHVRKLLSFTHPGGQGCSDFIAAHLHSAASARRELDEEHSATPSFQSSRRERERPGAVTASQPPQRAADAVSSKELPPVAAATLRHLLETIALWRFQQLLFLRWVPVLIFGSDTETPHDAAADSLASGINSVVSCDGRLRDGDVSCLLPLVSWCYEGRLTATTLPFSADTLNAGVSHATTTAMVPPPLLPLLNRRVTTTSTVSNERSNGKQQPAVAGRAVLRRLVGVGNLRILEHRLESADLLRSMSRSFLRCATR